jgi:hypothetical protein
MEGALMPGYSVRIFGIAWYRDKSERRSPQAFIPRLYGSGFGLDTFEISHRDVGFFGWTIGGSSSARDGLFAIDSSDGRS